MNFGPSQLPIDMTYTRSQNYTNMAVGKHEIQIFEVMGSCVLLLLLSCDKLCLHKCTSLIFLDK